MLTQYLRPLALGLGITFTFTVFCCPALAQSDGYLSQNNATGKVPFGSYHVAQIDNVNLGAGAVNLQIPLFRAEGLMKAET